MHRRRVVRAPLSASLSVPPAELTDQHRVYMGEGVLPLKDMMELLREKGYDGALSVEIFREEYWAKDPVEISVAAKAAYDRTMAL